MERSFALTPHALRALCASDGEPPLGGWYAEPLSGAQADELLRLAHEGLQSLYARRRAAGTGCHLLQMIARHWCGATVEAEYRTQRATAGTARDEALVELVYGQLLMSRKLCGAMEHLTAGFARAANLFAPDEYFSVLKRHALLGYLLLSERPSAPQDLASLLTEAAVIKRLETRGAARHRSAATDASDTVGW